MASRKRKDCFRIWILAKYKIDSRKKNFRLVLICFWNDIPGTGYPIVLARNGVCSNPAFNLNEIDKKGIGTDNWKMPINIGDTFEMGHWVQLGPTVHH